MSSGYVREMKNRCNPVPLGEAGSHGKWIGPVLHAPGWGENLMSREKAAGGIEIVDGTPRKRARGRVEDLPRLSNLGEGRCPCN